MKPVSQFSVFKSEILFFRQFSNLRSFEIRMSKSSSKRITSSSRKTVEVTTVRMADGLVEDSLKIKKGRESRKPLSSAEKSHPMGSVPGEKTDSVAIFHDGDINIHYVTLTHHASVPGGSRFSYGGTINYHPPSANRSPSR